MLENSVFNIKPKKPLNIVITKKKVIIGLIVFLTFFAILKVNSVGNLNKDLFTSKLYLVLASIKDISDTESFNKAFTKGNFCGWQITDVSGNKISSENYESSAKSGTVLEQQYNFNGIKNKLSICISNLARYDSSVKRQVLGLLLVAGILIFLIYNTKFIDNAKPEEKNIPTV